LSKAHKINDLRIAKKLPIGKSKTFKYPSAKFHSSNRKLPHQVDNSKLEITVLNVLDMNSMGVLSPRES
jgi:hypothetical protein